MNLIRRVLLLVGIFITVMLPAGAAQAAPPVVTAISPSSGPTSGMSKVVISGSGLNSASEVKFGAANAQIFAVSNDNEIVAIAPPGVGIVNVVVRNADGSSATSAATQFTYIAPTLSLSPASGQLPGAALEQPYFQIFRAAGGAFPYRYSVTAGTLPPGLALTGDGTLSGFTTTPGTFNFSVTASDFSTGAAGGPYTVTSAYSITVAASSLRIFPSTIPNGAIGQFYDVALAGFGGTLPLTWSIDSGALPAGVSLVRFGDLRGTPTAAGNFTFTVRVTDSSPGPDGPFSALQTYNLTIAPPTIVVSPSTLPNATVGRDHFQALTVSGGTAPYSFSLADGSLPAGLAISSDGMLSGTPTSAGTFNFSIKVTDSSRATGPFSATQAYSMTVAYPPPPRTPSITGPADGALLAQSLVNISGTSAPGSTVTVYIDGSQAGATSSDFSGNWTYRHSSPLSEGSHSVYAIASDAYGQTSERSASSTFTVDTIGPAAPVILSPANDSVLVPGSITVTGTAEAGASVAVRLNGSIDGTTFSNAAGGWSYTTPSLAAGDYAISATATDAAGNPSPVSAARSVTLASAPTVQDVTAPVPYNTATAIDLSSAIGGFYTSVAIGAAPAHGTVSVLGSVVTYTPATGYYGPDSFTYTATGIGGTSAAATVTLTVLPPAPPQVSSPPAVTVAGATTAGATSASIELATSVSGVYSSLALVSSPAHGTATLAGNVVTYVPALGYAGADSFTFQAQGPGGTSNLGTVVITVQPTAAVPQARTAAASDGETITVDLTAGATGGPFTGAAIVSVSPAAGTASIIEGGTAGNRTYAARINVADHFNGALVVRYTLSNAFGASKAATITVNVTARPDPSADPGVRALSEMQADSALRFAQGQTNNFMRRMESLHGNNNPGGADMGLRLTFPHLGDPGLAPFQSQMMVEKAMVAHFRANGANASAPTEHNSAATVDAARTDRPNGSISAWTGGTIEFGTQDTNNGDDKVKVSSNGVSLGADIKLADGIIVGLGGGFGWDRQEASGGGDLRGKSSVAVGYVSFNPRTDLFFDALLGMGSVDFKTRRPITGMTGEATARRGGSLTMGSVAFGIDTSQQVDWSVYGRAEWLAATLDAYVESGAERLSLRYDERRIESLGGVLGGRIGTSVQLGKVVARPRFKAEWRHEFQDLAIQTLDYASVAGPSTFGVDGINWSSNRLEAALGSAFLFPGSWSLDLELGLRSDARGRIGVVRVEMAKQF